MLSFPHYICEKGKTTILSIENMYIHLIKQTTFLECLVITFHCHILHFYAEMQNVLSCESANDYY